MQRAVAAIKSWFREGVDGWNRFWFTPADPSTLSLIRICTGAMLLYTHLVWTLALDDFFGPNAWESPEATHAQFTMILSDPVVQAVDPYGGRSFVWSYFYLLDTPQALWAAHIAA